METPIIEKFTSEDDGVATHVTKGVNGYHVSLKDLDADEFVGVNIICPTLDMAITKAKEIVGL